MADKPQAQDTHTAHQGGQEKLPLIQVVHQSQRRPGGDQPKQHPNAGLLKHQRNLRTEVQRGRDRRQAQLKAGPAALLQPQNHPHHTGSQSRQADPPQAVEGRADRQRQIDGLRRGAEVDIILIDKAQQELQDNSRSNPDQSPVQIAVLLAPLRLSLVIIHVF